MNSNLPTNEPPSSQRGHGVLLDLEPDGHLAQTAVHRHHEMQRRVEVVLEHRWSRMLQVDVRILSYLGSGHRIHFVPRRAVLDDARDVRDTQLAEGVRPMAAVVQN